MLRDSGWMMGLTIAVAVVGTAGAQTQVQPKLADEGAIAAQQKQVDEVLALWEDRSARTETLDVGFDRVDNSADRGEEPYKGRAYFQYPNLACVQIQKVDGEAVADLERMVWAGKEFYRFDYGARQIVVHPSGGKSAKWAPELGPLPLFFNMKVAEAKQRYRMRLLNQDANAYLIGVLPLLKEDREAFSQAYLRLSKKTFLPDRLLLVYPNGKDTQDYRFGAVALNQKLDPSLFAVTAPPGWKTMTRPDLQRMASQWIIGSLTKVLGGPKPR